MKNLGMTIELDPREDKISCPAFGLYVHFSCGIFHDVTHCVEFDGSCVSAQIA